MSGYIVRYAAPRPCPRPPTIPDNGVVGSTYFVGRCLVCGTEIADVLWPGMDPGALADVPLSPCPCGARSA